MNDNLLTGNRKRSFIKQKRENCKKGSFSAEGENLASFHVDQELSALSVFFHVGQNCRNERNFAKSRKAVFLLIVLS